MLSFSSVRSIKPPELIERVIVPHGFAMAPSLFVAMILCVWPCFFLYDLHGWWWALAGTSWILGLWLAWSSVWRWSRTVVIFTNQRVIGPVPGRWFVRMGEFPRQSLQETSWKPAKGIGRIFGLGKATFIGGSAKTALALAYCRGSQLTIAQPLNERKRQLIERIGTATEERIADLEAWFAKRA